MAGQNISCKIYGVFLTLVTFSLTLISYEQWSHLYSVSHVINPETQRHWITFQEVGGIGNDLFNFAISMQLARTHDMDLAIAKHLHLLRAFEINNVTMYSSIYELPENSTLMKEKGYFDCKYDASFSARFAGMTSNGAVLMGYFQSWKYFDIIEEQLRTLLKFKSHVEATAIEYIRGTVNLHTNFDDGQYILIGIHVRRGDVITNSKLLKYGYSIVPASYYEHAMDYFARRLKKRPLVFIVCSNDVIWSKKNLKHLQQNVIFSERNSDAVDLAILAKCKHVIISIGTFGWWGAWLSGGNAVYYKNWPRKGSELEKSVDKEEYFLRHWIAIE